MSQLGSMQLLNMVLQDRGWCGDLRLAMLAAADNAGKATIPSVMKWANCSDSVARELIDELVDHGALVLDVEGRAWMPEAAPYEPLSQFKGRRPIPQDTRAFIYERDEGQCRYCGTDTGPFHIDHVHPVSRGGSDDVANLVLACAACNCSKGAKTLSEWLGRRDG